MRLWMFLVPSRSKETIATLARLEPSVMSTITRQGRCTEANYSVGGEESSDDFDSGFEPVSGTFINFYEKKQH